MALHQNFCDKRVNVRNREEQELFEKWAMSQGTYVLSKEIDGSYLNGKTRCAFRAWGARSKIGFGWISVLDRMPVSGEIVILLTSNQHYAVVRYDDYANKWFEEYGMPEYEAGHVTHWMPIPEYPGG